MDTVLIIDWSNILSMCWYPALDAQDADPTKYKAEDVLLVNLDGKMGTIYEHMERYGVTDFRCVFAEDRRDEAKYALFPDYKSGRDLSRPKPPRELAKAHMQSKGFGWWVWADGKEADDVIATFVHRIGLKIAKRIIIVSGDKDLWPLMGLDNVFVYNPYTNKLVDINDVAKKFSVSAPKFIPLVKALWGDTSDAIPNAVPRMQKQLLPIIEATDGTYEDLVLKVAQRSDTLTDRCRQLLSDGGPQVRVNYQLVKLNPDCKVKMEET